MSHETAVGVIGDCAFDVTAEPTGAWVRGGDRPATIRVGPGGQGANVAVRLARRGRAVRLVTALGADLPGDWLRSRLTAEGVEVVTPAATAARSSMVVAVLDETGERTMLSDRAALDADSATLAAALGHSRWIHCSGYVLRATAEAAPIVEFLAARPPTTRLSVGGGSVGDSETAGALEAALRRTGPDLLVVSLDEARWLCGDLAATAADAVAHLNGVAAVVVVTAGIGGADAGLAGGPAIHVPPADHGPAVDATGAGDAFAATLLAGLLDAAWPPAPDVLRSALADASQAGGRVARVAGAQGYIPGEGETGTVSGA